MKTFLRLPVKLTEEECLSRGQRAGELGYDLTQVEEREKETKAAFKAQKERLQGEINDLLNQLRSGKEWREVEVFIYKDFKQRLEVKTRLDTGEVVSTRPLAADEMQGELKLADSEPVVEQQNEEQPSQADNNSMVSIEDAKKMDDEELFELASRFALKQDDPTVVTIERLQLEFKVGQTKAKRILKRLKEEDCLSYPSNPPIEEQQDGNDWVQEDDEQFGDDELGEPVDEDNEEIYDGPSKVDKLKERMKAAREKSLEDK